MSEHEAGSSEPSELRKRAEVALQNRPPITLDTPAEEIDQLVHELRTHQIELEMQNEELRRAQEELAESQHDYADLYDFAPVGYVTLSDKGLIMKSNLIFPEMLGKERRSLANVRFSQFIVDDNQNEYYQFRRDLLDSRERKFCDLRMHKEGDDPFWVRLNGAVVQTAEDTEIQLRLAIMPRKNLAAAK